MFGFTFNRTSVYLGLLLCTVQSGCQPTPPPEFRLNKVEWIKQEKLYLPNDEHFDSRYEQQIGTILHALFGTPDDPRFPMLAGGEGPAQDIVDLENLKMAAGSVNSDKQGIPSGLYREHCAHCHGISGDGAGPTAAFLNPYPRDFRLGKFKFKSTPIRRPPTDHDLESILIEGIPGTAMPSFRTLSEHEIDALVDYVKYLTIRGQFERFLIGELAGLDGDPVIDLSLLEPGDGSDEISDDELDAIVDEANRIFGDELLDGIIKRWLKRDNQVSEIPPAPAVVNVDHENHEALIDQGRELFVTKGNCLQCHGATGLGDGQTANYDDWTREWIKSSGVDPLDPGTYQDFLAAGALPPRPIRPRNLRLPVYRGGSHPNDLYLRIANGIEGTPMPSSAVLTPEETWALVAYVKSMPYQDIGSPSK